MGTRKSRIVPHGWEVSGCDLSVGGRLGGAFHASPSRCGLRRWRWPPGVGFAVPRRRCGATTMRSANGSNSRLLPPPGEAEENSVTTFLELAPPTRVRILPMHSGFGGRLGGEDAGPSPKP